MYTFKRRKFLFSICFTDSGRNVFEFQNLGNPLILGIEFYQKLTEYFINSLLLLMWLCIKVNNNLFFQVQNSKSVFLLGFKTNLNCPVAKWLQILHGSSNFKFALLIKMREKLCHIRNQNIIIVARLVAIILSTIIAQSYDDVRLLKVLRSWNISQISSSHVLNNRPRMQGSNTNTWSPGI